MCFYLFLLIFCFIHFSEKGRKADEFSFFLIDFLIFFLLNFCKGTVHVFLPTAMFRKNELEKGRCVCKLVFLDWALE